jgi:hypothetical protein
MSVEITVVLPIWAYPAAWLRYAKRIRVSSLFKSRRAAAASHRAPHAGGSLRQREPIFFVG